MSSVFVYVQHLLGIGHLKRVDFRVELLQFRAPLDQRQARLGVSDLPVVDFE